MDIKKIAKLANLIIIEDEEKKFGKQLEETIQYFDKLNELDTTGIEPTSQVTGLENVLREDEVKPSLTQEEAIRNSKSTQNGYFKVPRILEE